MSLVLNATSVSVKTSPVKSVLCPSVFNKNLGKSASTVGTLVNPLPLSVISIAVITPPITVALPNAPAPPPPGFAPRPRRGRLRRRRARQR